MLILFRLIKNLHTKRASPSILPRNPFLPALLNLYTLFQILPCHENIRLVNTLLRRLTILSIEILRMIEIFVFSVELRIKWFKCLQNFRILFWGKCLFLNNVLVHELVAASAEFVEGFAEACAGSVFLEGAVLIGLVELGVVRYNTVLFFELNAFLDHCTEVFIAKIIQQVPQTMLRRIQIFRKYFRLLTMQLRQRFPIYVNFVGNNSLRFWDLLPDRVFSHYMLFPCVFLQSRLDHLLLVAGRDV